MAAVADSHLNHRPASSLAEKICYRIQTSLKLADDQSYGVSWFSAERVQHFNNLYQALGDFSENIELFDNDFLKSIRNHLYSSCFLNIKSYSEVLPEETDPYFSAPIIHFYAIISDINHTLFHRWYDRQDPDDPETKSLVYFDQKPEDIPFCTQHGFEIAKDITINNFNMSELMKSLDIFEHKMHNIGYCRELVLYIEALELRVNDFILFSNTIEYHNVANLRKKHPHEDSYVCTTYGEYMLAIRIIAIKRDLEGSLDHLRDHNDCVRPVFQAELDAVTLIHKNMLYLSQDIHSDIIQDEFTESYEENSIKSSIGYQWLKGNKYSNTPEALGSITQFEGDAYWKGVCVQSSMDISEHFFNMDNPTAFWIIFLQLVELLIMSCLENDWNPSSAPADTGSYVSDYFITNNTLKIQSPDQLDMLIIKSNEVPIFLQCFSDASILFQEKLYVFGHTPVDYLRAFHSWVDIIENCFDGLFLGKIPICRLREKLYNPDIQPNVDKYIKKTNISVIDKFNMSLKDRIRINRDARISLLSTTMQDFELVSGTSIYSSDPFLADANQSIWF